MKQSMAWLCATDGDLDHEAVGALYGHLAVEAAVHQIHEVACTRAPHENRVPHPVNTPDIAPRPRVSTRRCTAYAAYLP